MPDVSTSARDIFLSALERATPVERAEFISKACGGDAALRQHVEALLRVHDEPDSLLDQPRINLKAPRDLAESPATIDPQSKHVGTVIGPYKIHEQIGEGGMGLVYMAEQQRPVRRLVALKVVKPGMDSRQVITRFEAERQALAMMDHSNIARVLDAGTTETGRPYFVMELVRGVPINEFCDQKRLTVRERLELFIQVCQAVQHAHQKGIIHRALKPTNVLVTMADTVPVPKVIDFGIAKALGAQLTEHTLHTGFTQLVGTPLYMSPEQAEMNQFGVDTRSDVYSLGVMLYELLTGTIPFDKDTLTKVGFDEMRRIIREEEPETVSTRMARTRRVGSAHHPAAHIPHSAIRIPQLHELDWIVMKALAKDRSDRYESASSLAADLQRYLSGDLVHACPPSAAYRFRKFAKKHRTAFTTVTLLAASLLLGTTISVWQAIRATAAEAQATANEIEAVKEKQNAIAAQESEAALRKQAEKSLEVALEAVDRMLSKVSDPELSNVPRIGPLRRQILNDAVAFHQRIAPLASNSSSGRFRAAKTWYTIAGLGRSAGAHEQARKAYETAIEMMTQLVQEQPGQSKYKSQLAEMHELAGFYYAHERASDSHELRHEKAEEHFRKAVELSAELGRQNRQTRSLCGLAETSLAQGKRDEGIAAARRALELMQSGAAGSNLRGQLLTVLGNLHNADAPAEADIYFRQSIAEFRKYLSQPRSNTPKAEFANALHQAANAMALRHPEEAEQLLDESIAVWRELCSSSDNALTHLPHYCASLETQVHLLRRLAIRKTSSNDAVEAARLEKKSDVLFQELLDRQRQIVLRLATVDSRPTLLQDLKNEVEYLLRRPAAPIAASETSANARKLQADALLTEAIQLCRALAAEFPDNPDYKSRLATLEKLHAQHFGQKSGAVENP